MGAQFMVKDKKKYKKPTRSLEEKRKNKIA